MMISFLFPGKRRQSPGTDGSIPYRFFTLPENLLLIIRVLSILGSLSVEEGGNHSTLQNEQRNRHVCQIEQQKKKS